MPKQNDLVTQSYLDQKLEEFFETKFDAINKRFDKLMQKLDWFTGKYTKFDEEQNLISSRVADHSDRLEVVEKKLGITPWQPKEIFSLPRRQAGFSFLPRKKRGALGSS